jgi:uncharacterized damage-inducible protein DinB
MDDFTRHDPPASGPERDMLIAFLEYHRATMLMKVSGVSDADLRRSIVPSGITLLGMVKHLGYVERHWFPWVFAAEEEGYPWTEQYPNGGFRVEPGETLEQVLALYRMEVGRSRRITAAASLEDMAQRRIPYYRQRSQTWQPTLRWILLHMIEEMARHNGHADLLRESIDGVTGE